MNRLYFYVRAADQPLPAWIPPAVALVLGAVGLLRLEEAAGRLMHTGSKEHGRMGRVVLAVTLHNLPEGMVVGLAAALALQGEPEAVSGALALALGIGLQNIPEGAAVSLPLVQAGQGRRKAFCAGAASGLVEPLGALLALALAGWVSAALPWLMSAAAGCMVCVTAQEMIPEAVEQDEPAGVISVVLGFALMMALDIAL
ncbi:MAG: ZIP family metal transporter [Faecalibacterium prausnitzii]|nr:ZIP family metal transporter [Faecalibacterium prausnitzii]